MAILGQVEYSTRRVHPVHSVDVSRPKVDIAHRTLNPDERRALIALHARASRTSARNTKRDLRCVLGAAEQPTNQASSALLTDWFIAHRSYLTRLERTH